MRTFSGRTIGLLESRQRAELAAMVVKLGGTPVCAPSVREVPRLDDIDGLIGRIVGGDFQMCVALTGAAASTLLREADHRGRLDDVRHALEQMTLVCRGPKPLAVLRRHGLSASVVTAKPHTTAELLEALEETHVDGLPVLLLHYGEQSTVCGEALAARGARVENACLYEWALPEDTEPIRALIRHAAGDTLDALLFTTQVQFRHLVQVADEMDLTPALVGALNMTVVVGAIGPVCASALRVGGVVPDVMPASPNSASLVSAVADYYDLTSRVLDC